MNAYSQIISDVLLLLNRLKYSIRVSSHISSQHCGFFGYPQMYPAEFCYFWLLLRRAWQAGLLHSP